MKNLIYIVDDEENILEILSFNLEKNDFDTKGFANENDFLKNFHLKKPDLVILDLMLPDMDGYDICKKIKNDSDIPVMMLSAKGEEFDRVLRLELGADDYIVKPFSNMESVVRVKNIIKRSELAKNKNAIKPLKKSYNFGKILLDIDEEKHTISLDSNIVFLNPKEYQTLTVLLKNLNNLVTRNDLIKTVWGEDYYGDTRTLDVHIRRIREKMSYRSFGQDHIKTVHGLGYKITDDKKQISAD